MLLSKPNNHSAGTTVESSAATKETTSWLPEIDTECLRNMMKVAFLAISRNCTAEARAIFEGLVILRPDSECPILGLAVAEMASGNLRLADEYMDAAWQRRPDAPHALAIRSVLQLCRESSSHSLPGSSSQLD